MVEAALWGLAGASSLLIGAVIGLKAEIPGRYIGLILGFGAGTLISALAFELTDEAFKLGGADAVAIGLAAGALTYYVGDLWVESRGAKGRMGTGQHGADTSGMALLLGAVLDGIPESAVIGISLLEGGTVGVPVLAAVFLSNLPEAISSTAQMKQHDSGLRIMGLWSVVVVVSGLAALAGYAFLDGASGNLTGFIQAFAAGAVLTMLADTMMPAAYEHARKARDSTPAAQERAARIADAVGLMTVLGFALAYLLSTLE
jgi:ZIP family zinc transporter